MTSLIPGIATTSPSLALIKYWGKSDQAANRPATPSLAITLRHLQTETRVWAIDATGFPPGAGVGDLVVVGGKSQPAERYVAFFDALRREAGNPALRFWAESGNNFPTSAGLASSSSGFAALTLAAARACGLVSARQAGRALPQDLLDRLSGLARQGSGSAARALYGGYTLLPADAEAALPLHPAAHWPELRVLVVRISEAAKDVSSRVAMERTRQSSPYYPAWLTDAQAVCDQAQPALAERDLGRLGPLIQASYLRMFATMFAASPPVIYWQPASLALIKLCQGLRDRGIAAWETMDAGPQVKIFCLASDCRRIGEAISAELPDCGWLVDEAGDGPAFPPHTNQLREVAAPLQAQAAALGVQLAHAT